MTGAIGPLINVATASESPAIVKASESFSSKTRPSIHAASTMNAVNPTSIRAVCADPQTSNELPQMNAASGPPILHIR